MKLAKDGTPIIDDISLDIIADYFQRTKGFSAFRRNRILLDTYIIHYGNDVLKAHLSSIAEKWERINFPQKRVKYLQPKGR